MQLFYIFSKSMKKWYLFCIRNKNHDFIKNCCFLAPKNIFFDYSAYLVQVGRTGTFLCKVLERFLFKKGPQQKDIEKYFFWYQKYICMQLFYILSRSKKNWNFFCVQKGKLKNNYDNKTSAFRCPFFLVPKTFSPGKYSDSK